MWLVIARQSEAVVERELGELMNASHESCRVAYACSCNELDELCAAFRCAPSALLGFRVQDLGFRVQKQEFRV